VILPVGTCSICALPRKNGSISSCATRSWSTPLCSQTLSCFRPLLKTFASWPRPHTRLVTGPSSAPLWPTTHARCRCVTLFELVIGLTAINYNKVFPIADPIIWARYVRIEFHTHYGREFYCPLSLVRVHGITMMEDYRDEILDMLVDNDDDDDVSRAAAAEDEQQRMESETLKIDAVAEIASDYMRNFGLMRSEALRLLSRALQSVADLFDIVDGTATAEHVLGKEAAAPSPKPSNQPPLIGSSRRQNPPQPQMQTRSSSTSSAPTVPPSAATVTTSPNGQHEHRPSGTSNPKRSAAMSPSLDQLRQFAASPRALIECNVLHVL